ncbi:MAG: glycosyltransferase family 39 protein [Ahniella sp.]|nr:glycosyltransferase family 39 protein [Ahniella sp.]
MSHRAFWLAFGTVAFLRLILAANVPLFGDEAFYWQESRRLAAGYSDLPAGTAWLIAMGQFLFGHSLLALRWPFVCAGLLTVLLVRVTLRRITDPDTANRGGLLALLLPIGQAVGVLAIPDVVLTLFLVLGSIALIRAKDDDRWRWWLLFGVALACAWAVHWRTVMIYAAGGLLLVGDPSARRLWKSPRHWIAQGIGLTGLLPSLMFNAATDWPALRFQAVDRHDWGFHAGGLMMPLEQMVAVSPLFFVLALLAACQWARSAEANPSRSYAWLGLGLFGAYFLIGCFADQERTRIHWPAPAFLLLIPALLCWIKSPSRMWPWLAGTAALVSAIMFGGLAILWQKPAWTEPFGKRFGANFIGYDTLAETVQPMLAASGGRVLIADNFLLAAQLDWQLGRSPYVLDAARNAEHGRAVQLELWALDESALQAQDWQRALLVVDDSALFAADRFGFYASLCQRLGGLEFAGEHMTDDGRRRFTLWSVDRRGANCRQPILSMLFPIEHRAEQIIVGGYAVQHLGRVRAVHLDVEGQWLATDVLGPQGPVVDTHWPELRDANGEHVGFRFELDRAALRPGPLRYRLVAEADDGQRREIDRFVLDPAQQ